MSKLSIAPIVMTTITFITGVYWLFIYFRKRTSKEDLSFSLTCFAIGVYAFHCIGLYNSTSVEEGVLWQRGQMASTGWIAIFFSFFVSHYTKMVSKKFLIAVIVFFFGIIIISNFASSNLTWAVDRPSIKNFELFGNTITYYEADAGPIIDIQLVALILCFLFLMWAAVKQYRYGDKRRAKPLIIAMVIYFLTVINDMSITAGFFQSLYLSEYGYISIVLMMAYSLSNEIVEALVVKERQKEMEKRLLQAQKLEAIGRLAGGIAHDLNNQLTPIVGYSEIALSRERPVADLRRFIDQIRDSAEHAKELTWQLLAFGRKQVLDMAVVNINTVIGKSERMLRHVLPEDIEFKLSLNPEINNIRADSVQFHQILMNLVLNARDAMPNGGLMSIETDNVKIDRLGIGTPDDLKHGHYVMLMVSDTGMGMDQETIQHVFEPFFTTKKNGEGSGWGLATVYGIVKQHGGSISIYSEPGRGSTFRIYFPRTEKENTLDSEIPIHPTDFGGGETVLVVEDESAVRKMVCEVLESFGFVTIQAADPQKAYALATQHEGKIHLLLTDVIMPKMNGKQLFDRISAERKETKVIYMSGYAGEVIAHKGILEEGVSLLSKPFSIAKLVEMVRETLDLPFEDTEAPTVHGSD